MKQIRLYLSVLLFSTFLLQYSCTTFMERAWLNENIPADTRDEMDDQIKKLINIFQQQTPEKFEAICHPDLWAKIKNEAADYVKMISPTISFDQLVYHNNMYKTNSPSKESNSVFSGMGDADYSIFYENKGAETFVSTGYFKNDTIQTAMTATFCKIAEGWKLTNLHFGNLSYYHQDAPSLFQEGKVLFEKGHLMDASIKFALLGDVLKPGGKNWVYHKEEEMIKYANEAGQQTIDTYTFPITIDKIPSLPKIMGFSSTFGENSVRPLIDVQTSIPLNDTTKISIECDAIHAMIGTIFPGVDLNNEHIVYSAYNEVEEGAKEALTYTMIK